MQKLITPEKSPMFYCDRFDYTLSDNLHLGGGRDVRDYIPEEELLKICRPVFTLLKLVKSESYMVDYLYWLKPTDLDEIDEKVRTDTYEDADFKYSIKAYFTPKVWCFHCNQVVGKALVVGHQIYPYHFDIECEKKKNRQEVSLRNVPSVEEDLPYRYCISFKDD